MKKLKLIVIYWLITIGFIFNGELFILYLDGFQESYYQSGFDFVNREAVIEEKEVIQDFLNAGKTYDVDFFFVDSTIVSAYNKQITIFGTPNALKNLEDNGIFEGKHNSLFMGETQVRYADFSNIKTMEKFKDCYYIGDQSQQETMRLFKASLVGKYGGGLPKLFRSDKETWLNLLAVWSIVFGLILLLTIYEIISLKKEIMVRITLGEDVRAVFGKNALADIGILVSAFLSVPFILSLLSNSNVLFKIKALALSFLVFMIANTLINAAVLRVNFKKDIAARRSGGGLLTANYILKTMTTILTLIVLSSNFTILAQGYLMYKQGDFFSEHKDYSYYQLNYRVDNHLGKTISDDDMINQEFYKRFQNYSLQYNDLTANFSSPYPIILINRNSFEEISRVSNALSEAVKSADDDYYILIPSGISEDSQEYAIAEEIFTVFLGRNIDSSTKIKTKVYDGDISLVGIHNMGKYVSRPMVNPIILFNNTLQQIDESQAGNDMYYAYSTMYDIPEQDFNNFIAEYQLSDQIMVKSNALDVYEHNWAIIARNMKLVVILSIFLLALEIALISFIIKLEYQFNAMELALKKVLGYSLFARNSRLMRLTFVVFLVSVMLAFLLRGLLGIAEGADLIWGGLILLALESVFIAKKAGTMEKANVPAILKGRVL
ncbi:hypothetical protein E4K67_00970 [Desulfosporosinus fructosivorans]|uniref:DUF1430 domain-containing protein n=1 Tax=Desulfosporosinus fructosivorans TaxID=2018669 RepID=A0A4Z0R911_9FIRM|nr:hypothetical protein [Desulfosporosinus fructosivorans]TGE39612.1 hypothetical protein E4K67_00970 [Desulfosporosinus fructosivorans]